MKSKLPEQRVVAVAVVALDDPTQILVVRRPPDDEDLPNAWGLPAGRIVSGEMPAQAVIRAGREKLGVELGRVRRRASGTMDRERYRLTMVLYNAVLDRGVPQVPQAASGVTQYAEWRWSGGEILEPAAMRGSLCCRLFLESMRSEMG